MSEVAGEEGSDSGGDGCGCGCGCGCPAVWLASCEEVLCGGDGGELDDECLAVSLRRRGLTVRSAAWTDSHTRWTHAQVVVLRTTWDYHRCLPRFLDWARQVEQEQQEVLTVATTGNVQPRRAKTLLLNDSSVIEWNASKRYLLQLQQLGIPIIPSFITGSATEAKAAAIQMLQQSGCIIIKPTISGSAELTHRITQVEDQDFTHKVQEILTQSEIIIQPFVNSIVEDGEVSLMFIRCVGEEDARFTHAVLKTAKRGDFRVQTDYGGHVESIEPPAALIELALASLRPISNLPYLYARIDIVNWKSASPMIGEVEVIEPAMFFKFDNKAADLFAEQIEKRILIRSKR